MISKNIFHLSIDFIIKNIYILSKKQNELKCKILYCDTSLHVCLLYFFMIGFCGVFPIENLLALSTDTWVEGGYLSLHVHTIK